MLPRLLKKSIQRYGTPITIQVRPIEAVDFVPALRQVKASVSQDDLETYLKWNQQYGATG